MTGTTGGPDEPLDDLDRLVLVRMREVYTTLDPPPQGLAERVKFALTLAALEAEVAQLQQLSTAAVRSDPGYAVTDTVTFTASAVSLMVTITADESPRDARTARVDGWVTGGGIDVELCTGTERRRSTSDANGRLAWERVPRGRARFLIHPTSEGAKPVVTPTIEI